MLTVGDLNGNDVACTAQGRDPSNSTATERRRGESGLVTLPPTVKVPESKPPHEALHLIAPPVAAQTPLAEVLAIVAEKMIAVLPETRAGAVDHLLWRESGRQARPHPHTTSVAEARERNLFHRSPGQEPGNGAAMDDLACTQIDAMMNVADSPRDEVRAAWRLLIVGQEMITSNAMSLLAQS